MRPISFFISNPFEIVRSGLMRFKDYLPDSLYLRLIFEPRVGYPLNLKNPQTFNEKLQWLKLYDRRPIYTTMVDKYSVKKYVADIIGKDYIIPTLGVWEKPEDIEWDKLPKQFVLKCTHDSGGLVICRDKSTLDKEAAMEKLRKSLNFDYYKSGREWPYKNVKRRIIAEKYIEPNTKNKDLPDYKWYCFNGEPKYCQVIQDRNTDETIDFFDCDWQHQEFLGLNQTAHHAKSAIERPKNLETQVKIAKELSKNIPYARIDLYEVDGHTFFGEITLYPGCGFGSFKPDKYNEILGEMIKLPEDKLSGGGKFVIGILDDGKLKITPPDLPDYKFFCFDGKVKAMFIATDRQVREEPYFDFFDENFNHLNLRHGHPNAPKAPSKPKNFDLMKDLAEKLSVGYPELRVDLYEVNGKVYFGELTLFHHSGFMPFDPEEWDKTFGDYIKFNR